MLISQDTAVSDIQPHTHAKQDQVKHGHAVLIAILQACHVSWNENHLARNYVLFSAPLIIFYHV